MAAYIMSDAGRALFQKLLQRGLTPDTWEAFADEYEGETGTARQGPYESYHLAFVDGVLWGLGWAFAIVGMAEAIRKNYGPSPWGEYLAARWESEKKHREPRTPQPSSDNRTGEKP